MISHPAHRTVFVAAVVAIAASCGAGDSGNVADDDVAPASTTPTVVTTVATTGVAAGTETTTSQLDTSDGVAPPAEPSGMVDIDGIEVELDDADLLLCETVNPAFDDAINIQARFDVPPGAIVMLGQPIASRMSISVLGELPDAVSVEAGDAETFTNPAQDITVSRDGRTVTGSAVVVDERRGASVTDDNPLSDNTIEFSFTC